MATLQEAIAKRKQRTLAESGSLNSIVHEALKAMMPDILEAFGPHIRQYVAQNVDKYALKGDPGTNAPPVNEDRIAAKAARLIPPVQHGKDADESLILRKLTAKIPPPREGPPGKNAVIDHEALAKKVAQKLKTDIKLKPEHIEGLGEMMESYWKKVRAQSKSGIMRGGGDTVLAGTGITITRDSVGRSTIASTGGGGFSTLDATETPDGINVVFTFSTASAKPSYIVADGVWTKATGKNGQVNWTWNAGAKQATLNVAPISDIYAIV